MPSILSCFPGTACARCKRADSSLAKIEFTKVDLPLPDTPLTTVITPRGKSTFIFFKLFSLAPTTVIFLSFSILRRFLGVSILSIPAKYLPVMLAVFLATSEGVP